MNPIRKLLVVDDESVVCESCSRIFTRHGFNVDVCTDSANGLDLANRNQYGAILLDMMMPGIDGIEFLRRLRDRWPNVPVIFITGYASVSSAAEAMRLGANDYIAKPFSPEEIVNAVERIMNEVSAPAAEDTVSVPLPEPAPVGETAPKPSGRFRFLGNSWVEYADSAPRAPKIGTAGPVSSGNVESILLPSPGGLALKGVPLAMVRRKNRRPRYILSPVTGKIKSVNTRLPDEPELLAESAFEDGWIARIEPLEPGAVYEGLIRRPVLAIAGEESQAQWREWIPKYGAEPTPAAPAGNWAAMASEYPAVIADCRALGPNAPRAISEIAHAAPESRIVLVNTPADGCELLIRSGRIFYHTHGELTEGEMREVLLSVFAEADTPGASRETPPGPQIKKLRVTNRQGQNTALFAMDRCLNGAAGLGLALREEALNQGRPIQIDLGYRPICVEEILGETKLCEKVILLRAEDRQSVPGSLRVLPGSEGKVPAPAERIQTFVIQTADGPAPLDFGGRVNRSIADCLLRAMDGAVL